jgi:diguanylate cyclase (GGDEF)-like protein/PAS domain S-box-containing protein
MGETIVRAALNALVFLLVMLPFECAAAIGGMAERRIAYFRALFLAIPPIACIFLPVELPGGIVVDGRYAAIILAGFSGGFPAGLPALALALAATLVSGGGFLPGFPALAIAWAFGALAAMKKDGDGLPGILARILGLSLVSALGMGAGIIAAAAPGDRSSVLAAIPAAALLHGGSVAACAAGYVLFVRAAGRLSMRAAALRSAREAYILIGNGRIADHNLRALELFECSSASMASVDPAALSPALGPGPGRIERALSGESFSCRAECSSLEGRPFSAELSFVPLEPKRRRFVAVLARDISLRKSEEDYIAVSKRVFDAASESIVVTDGAGAITYVNPAFTEMTGYAEGELIGRSPRVLRSGRHGAEFYAAMWNAIRSEGFWAGEVWNRKRGGEVFPCHERIVAHRNEEDGSLLYIGLLRDLSELARSRDELAFRRNRDSLTGFHNREGFMEILDRDLAGIGERRRLMLLALDISGFRSINQGYGHKAGDGILEELANRLRAIAREGLEFARLGGDEFLIELIDAARGYSVYSLWEALNGCFERAFPIPGGEISMAMCLGIALAKRGDSGIQLLKRAEIALEHAKQRGKGAYAFFQEGMERRAVDRLLMSRRLKEAIDRGAITVSYQPKVDLKTGLVAGLEALARWKDAELGPVSPASFIPLAEETGLIVRLGESVLATVLADMPEIHGKRGLQVAVNLSVKQFRNSGLVEDISRMLKEASVEPSALELEITESVFIDNLEEVTEICRGFKDFGFSLALDDFGTGYSSLTYLSHLPFDTLKLDKGFVVDIERDARRRAMLDAIISLSKALSIRTIVEGIEEQEQEALLSALGCDYGQGFLYSEALPLRDALAFIDARGVFRP